MIPEEYTYLRSVYNVVEKKYLQKHYLCYLGYTLSMVCIYQITSQIRPNFPIQCWNPFKE